MTAKFQYINELLFKSKIGFIIGHDDDGLISVDLEYDDRAISVSVIDVDIEHNLIHFKVNDCEKIVHSSQFIESIITELECQAT